MSIGKLHLLDDYNFGDSDPLNVKVRYIFCCGKDITIDSAEEFLFLKRSGVPFTDDISKVTCRNCLKSLVSALQRNRYIEMEGEEVSDEGM